MQIIESQQQLFINSVIYGPVTSRRLGKSLGINLFPMQNKNCNFNCVYCQYDKTNASNKLFTSFANTKNYIVNDFKKFSQQGISIDYITVAGNGEPTLHPNFPKIVDLILNQRDMYFSNIPTVIFTNCTKLYDPKIRKAISRFDRRFLKLDVSDQKTLLKVNHYGNFEKILNNIFITAKEMSVEISTAIITSPHRFANYDNLMTDSNYINIIKRISPRRLYLYSINKPSTHYEVEQVSQEHLLNLKKYLSKHFKSSIRVLY